MPKFIAQNTTPESPIVEARLAGGLSTVIRQTHSMTCSSQKCAGQDYDESGDVDQGSPQNHFLVAGVEPAAPADLGTVARRRPRVCSPGHSLVDRMPGGPSMQRETNRSTSAPLVGRLDSSRPATKVTTVTRAPWLRNLALRMKTPVRFNEPQWEWSLGSVLGSLEQLGQSEFAQGRSALLNLV